MFFFSRSLTKSAPWHTVFFKTCPQRSDFGIGINVKWRGPEISLSLFLGPVAIVFGYFELPF